MPKTTDAETLRLAEELIRYGVTPDRDSSAAQVLREISAGEESEPLSLKKAAAWLKAHGRGISYKTIRRQLGTTEDIRAGRVFVDANALRGGGQSTGGPNPPRAPVTPRLNTGFLKLELDNSEPGAALPVVEAAAPPNSSAPIGTQPHPSRSAPQPRRPEPAAQPRPAPVPGPDDDAWWLPENSIRHLIPDDDQLDKDGGVIFTRDELGRLCSAIYTSSVDLSQAAFCEGINPYKATRIVRKGLKDLAKDALTGERVIAMAIFGHWAGRVRRNGQAMAVASARGDVRAMKLMAERLDAQGPQLDEAKGGTMAALQAFARQVRAFAMGRDEEQESEHQVQVGTG